MSQVEVIALGATLGLLALVIVLIRRSRLEEGYSLLWMLAGIVLVLLAAWRGLLRIISDGLGIFYPPTALFVVGFGFVILILLQFSVVISRLSRENVDLVHRIALLEWKLDQVTRSDEQPGQGPAPCDPDMPPAHPNEDAGND
jgi:hypothetical protein